ncbi:Eco57I restriction-modification methylase domain-containing protein [Candidatus Nitrospira nitrificans]|uniref:site-specific DNA-methyltransferase (adenine-specific) n=1 Tax=Candidatus Nitrospira nitrificans TaxID=1742973 RepID=A0A0S4LCZ1_9BACT|nr:Eco57I restriction-modification methylase domain-containing protein [Candidatus Nitrospira nitrificans]CUS33787.1 Modification methylase BsuBI [Candidatus Nitrospira nitrificans]
MLSEVEQARLRLSKGTDGKKKAQFGQFLTPARTAAFMAGLFPAADGICHLLDAGAGIGSLTAAFLERCRSGDLRFQRVELDAFEIDGSLHAQLAQTLSKYRSSMFFAHVCGDDFIHAAVDSLSGDMFAKSFPKYSHAILNPPYKKISGNSAHRLALRRVGIETVNLYSAFVALAVAQAAPGGQIVAIIPRSFCNGPYYRPFRDFILERAAIRHIHLFESRSTAFKDDAVLQENIIVRLEHSGLQGSVTVSTSTDDTFYDLVSFEHAFERIVFPSDPERFIHVPTSPELNGIELCPTIQYTLADLGIKVSTGPVVDFRLKEHLRAMPGESTVPLLYPGHFSDGEITWPIEGMKKPNAIERNAHTEKWLYPTGYYCVVRRFSSKEETRRIVASVVEPTAFGGVPMLGFENHLNVFHGNRRGLPQVLVHGLALFLNTTAVDKAFRRFNGHTQVNATDLMLMKYPSRDVLTRLGEWAMEQEDLTQSLIDAKFGAVAA